MKLWALRYFQCFPTSIKSYRSCFFSPLDSYQFGTYGRKKKKTNRPFGQWQLIFKTESLPPQRQTHSRKLKAAKWSGFPGYNHLTILLPMGMLTESSPKWHFVICHTYAWLHPAKEQEATWVLFVKGMIWIIVVKNKSAFNEQRTKEIPSHRKESIFCIASKK